MKLIAHRALAVVLLLAPFAAAQPEPDPLRGPAVPDTARRTLIHRSMTGDFQRVEGRPEAAAVQLLDLDEETRERVTEVLDARDMAVAMLLVEEIDAVKVISDASLAEDRPRVNQLMHELWETFDPETSRSPLLAPLAEVLPPAQHAELTRIVDEYWDALVAWQTRDQPDDDPERIAAQREQTERRLAYELFAAEVGTGYNATLLRYRQAMDALYEAVQPTDEQREQMRTILVDHIRETQLQPTPEQRRATNRRIYDLLDEERRGLMFDYLLLRVVPDN